MTIEATLTRALFRVQQFIHHGLGTGGQPSTCQHKYPRMPLQWKMFSAFKELKQ